MEDEIWQLIGNVQIKDSKSTCSNISEITRNMWFWNTESLFPITICDTMMRKSCAQVRGKFF